MNDVRPGRPTQPPRRAATIAGLAALALVSMGAAFESHWQDGKAELDGYRYTVTRYGHARAGTAVMVYVTEPFSEAKRVKVDHPTPGSADVVEALKLNFIRDFQTGIYDYNTMVSLFARSRDFSPMKISFSGSEWCGNVYEEMLFERYHLADRYQSYFEGESDARRLTLVKPGIAEEELFILLRDLRSDWLAPGQKRKIAFLPAAFYRRLTHRPLIWTQAVIERGKGVEAVTVPAGRFDAVRYVVKVADGREGTFWVERAYPHRILRWTWLPAAGMTQRGGWSPAEGLDQGELAGSQRLPYWQLHEPGDEKYLAQLGLKPQTAIVGGTTRLRGDVGTTPSKR
ncbi:MAG TPA: hypothetical protein VFR25_02215 [Candidatus Eisenbacteria bacterium]|nr:hypothetical protein [Candidatus Eisenbacteria bacterium]